MFNSTPFNDNTSAKQQMASAYWSLIAAELKATQGKYLLRSEGLIPTVLRAISGRMNPAPLQEYLALRLEGKLQKKRGRKPMANMAQRNQRALQLYEAHLAECQRERRKTTPTRKNGRGETPCHKIAAERTARDLWKAGYSSIDAKYVLNLVSSEKKAGYFI